MVGHDAPNALEPAGRVWRTRDEIELERRIIGQLVTALRDAITIIRNLETRLEGRQP